jgi:uncharacterized membrane protein (DUF2068 family)
LGEDTALNETYGRSTLGFRIIGAMKLASGAVAVLAGFGIFRLLHRDLGETLEHIATRAHLDPENRLVQAVVTRVSSVTPKQLKVLGVGTFFYAALHLIEGTGLILLKTWAEYLTVIATSSLLPLEIYEIAQKQSLLRFSILLVNIVIVVYLIYRLRQDHKDRKAASTRAPAEV